MFCLYRLPVLFFSPTSSFPHFISIPWLWRIVRPFCWGARFDSIYGWNRVFRLSELYPEFVAGPAVYRSTDSTSGGGRGLSPIPPIAARSFSLIFHRPSLAFIQYTEPSFHPFPPFSPLFITLFSGFRNGPTICVCISTYHSPRFERTYGETHYCCIRESAPPSEMNHQFRISK